MQELLVRRNSGNWSRKVISSLKGRRPTLQGEVFFNDVPKSKTYKIGLDGKVSVFLDETKRETASDSAPTAGCMPSPGRRADRRLRRRRKTEPPWSPKAFAATTLVDRHDGGIYVTNPGWNGTDPHTRCGTSVPAAKRRWSTRD